MNEDWYKSIPIFNNQLPRSFENFSKDYKFEDEEFKADKTSLISPDLEAKILENFNKNSKGKKEKERKNDLEILLAYDKWERISDLPQYKNYELFPPELDSDNFDQGDIGDCYFLSMVALISKESNLLKRLFPIPKNSFGYYEVILFINGWKRVIIDDRIPGSYNKKNEFIPLQSTPKKESFYNFLIEKAWAKVNKSYYNIYGGHCFFSLKVLTGFNSTYEILNFSHDLKEQYYFLEKIYNGIKIEHQLFGVQTHSHAYSLLDIQKKFISFYYLYHLVMEIRNPWGCYFYEDIFEDLIEQKKNI